MKPLVPHDVRQQVLKLRRYQSISEVAAQTGLPIGTVKTICSRSGAFRDNIALRELFTLPPIQASESRSLAVPQLPPQNTVTGDHELDALLWLREVIKTGHVSLVEKAMLGAKQIKTPLLELEKRYTNHLVSQDPGNWVAALRSINFADLDGLARSSIKKLTRQTEATARFGNDLFANTPAEKFCIDALSTIGGVNRPWKLSEAEVDECFRSQSELTPHTLSDCLFELAYWRELSSLRYAACDCDDSGPESSARQDYVFRCLASIRPRTIEEAIAVFHYLAASDSMNRIEVTDILINLIGHKAVTRV
ncbi:MAG: hypothetical protein WCG50_04090 [Rhodoferax sp.]|uniref:hypothetical protein n=1 Tax=Rhodoferax sp. TaxID=50421 RepID=UPI0030199518